MNSKIFSFPYIFTSEKYYSIHLNTRPFAVTIEKHENEQKNVQKDKSRKFIFSRHSFDVML